MNSGYVNPNLLNQPAADEFSMSSLLHDAGDNLTDGLSWDNLMNMNAFNPTPPAQQPYQSAGGAAEQQLMKLIPADDISNVNYTPQFGHAYDTGNSFPFPLQEAPQDFGTPNTAPSTSRSPESTPRSDDSPFTNHTTSPEANPQPPQPAPKKRGRKKKVVKNEAEAAQIRQKFLERNRIAASKCREKKRGQTDKMQNDVHDLKNQNIQLKHDLEYLQGYVQYLRNALEPHVETNCHNDSKVLAILGRRDEKLPARPKAPTNEPMDLDGMSYKTESDEMKTMEARKASVDSAVADLSTPTQLFSA